MNEKAMKKENELPPYVSRPHSPEEEPNYKELYFNLLEQFETVRTFIRMIQDKSMKELNKSFKPTRVDIDATNNK